jgi:predicted ester cyclase
MSIEEENKALILRFYDLYNRKEIDAAYELFAPEYIFHSPTGDMSREQAKQFDTMALAAGFPDLVCSVVDIVAEGDKVAFRVNAKGTHTGLFMGVASTGKKFEMNNTWIVKIGSHKWVEQWGTSEIPNMMQQLGAIPT